MANPFPFVAGSVLTAAELNGIGEAAISFTPTFTNYTRGNGTSIAYYMRVNKLVYVYVDETLGSTSAVTGSVAMTLPFAATSLHAIEMGNLRYTDASGGIYISITSATGATSTTLRTSTVSGSLIAMGNTSATSPFTFTSTDSFRFQFVYEAV